MKFPAAHVRGYFVILAAAVGTACGDHAATPTAPGSAISQSSGFFISGPPPLNYRLDVGGRSGPVAAVVSRLRRPADRASGIPHIVVDAK
jgi:hypothetical protein